MLSYITLNKESCKNCYKCIRHCPVKSIRFTGGQAKIIEEDCILCGECYVICPQNAKEIISSLEAVKILIEKNEHVYMSIAPSFVAEYPKTTIETMKEAIKKLGFYDVEETAVGATIVKKEYERILKEEKPDILISSCCPSVNNLIQKYYPESLKHLASVISPMKANARQIKLKDPLAKVVFLGPCISKKQEADQDDIVDAVITYEELNEWLLKENIKIKAGIDNTDKSKARLFPIEGGIIKTMEKLEDYTYLAIDGIEQCKEALESLKNNDIKNCFIEMSSCVGSCINGPVINKQNASLVKSYLSVVDYAGEIDFDTDLIEKDLIFQHHEMNLCDEVMPSEVEIKRILALTGKYNKEDELNCGGCGYSSCREKAIAVFQGKADIDMCLPYIKARTESFSDNIINNSPNGIIVLNDELEFQKCNRAALKMFNLKTVKDVLGFSILTVMDSTDYLNVQLTGKPITDKRIYLAQYDKYIEESIIYDKTYRILIAIIRDISDVKKLSNKKEQVDISAIDAANKVVEKQMKVAQQIASLLGETVAETKSVLTNLKKQVEDSKDE